MPSASRKLLIIGPAAADRFAEELGVEPAPVSEKPENRWIEYEQWLGGTSTLIRSVIPKDGTEVWGWMHTDNDILSPKEPAATIRPYGKGLIAAIWFEMGNRYAEAMVETIRRFTAGLVDELFPNPIVTVTGSKYVDVTAMEKNDKLTINLVNTAGPHSDDRQYVFDDIPPVGPLKITLRLQEKPSRILRYPGRCEVPFDYYEGAAHLVLDRLEIHDVLVIE
jgi:hypothetical protein